MKKFHSVLFVVILYILCSVTTFAQAENPKVSKYFAPKYPVTAQAVRAAGTVIVNVKIDKEGKVISAVAESGHPLLRKVSEIAAKQWFFSTASNTKEREVKISFLIRQGDRNKKDKLKFRKPYTLEVVVARSRIIIDKHPGY